MLELHTSLGLLVVFNTSFNIIFSRPRQISSDLIQIGDLNSKTHDLIWAYETSSRPNGFITLITFKILLTKIQVWYVMGKIKILSCLFVLTKLDNISRDGIPFIMKRHPYLWVSFIASAIYSFSIFFVPLKINIIGWGKDSRTISKTSSKYLICWMNAAHLRRTKNV